ncbi:hypothetical protein SAMN04515674_101213 [Pseudarcicella hirudinis]|uniref:Uncharacterized protein n=1 Tax=Pseudarcicella hirudinis TaxID=1079859 RepID=A0A1I5MAR9_9BACT|nr:hypothetical protein [Pseudarcicella hirudinis]SFP06573.1 hypothetical protein SAMN04515674_101213 [Pseudarcicella hirudinis]
MSDYHYHKYLGSKPRKRKMKLWTRIVLFIAAVGLVGLIITILTKKVI